jgi:hypothetical protein
MAFESFSENPFAWLFVEAVGVIVYFLGLSRFSLLVAYTLVIGTMWFLTSGWAKRKFWVLPQRQQWWAITGIVFFEFAGFTAWNYYQHTGFVILYGDSRLDGQIMPLVNAAADPRRLQVQTHINSNDPTMFTVTGISARNDDDVPIQPDAAYLSFNAPIQIGRANSSLWQLSPDRDVEGWSTFKAGFFRGSIEPEHSIPFFDFVGTPIPTTNVLVRLTLIYGLKKRTAEFTITPPSTKMQAP